jgi:Mg-chelatase subunit ChlD
VRKLIPSLFVAYVVLGGFALQSVDLPAVAASKPTVTVSTASTVVPSGPKITLKVAVKKAAKEQTLTVQRRLSMKAKWATIRMTTVSNTQTISQSVTPRLGANYFRASLSRKGVVSGATSKSIKVTGKILTSPMTPLTTRKTSFSGYLPTSFERPVQLQQWRAKKWVRVASGVTSATGKATLKYKASAKTTLRIYAPATSYKGKPRSAFGSPRLVVVPKAPEDPTIDSDSDRLPDYIEQKLGTSSSAGDTDRDGLTDEQEVLVSTDPTKKDTDGNGIADPVDDLDGDGVSNRVEVADGTIAYKSDSDEDGLSDKKEKDLRTDPLKVDTDGDSVDDGTEVEVGSDPLVADSDGDGKNDADETYRAEVEGPDGTTLEASGPPRAVATVKVLPVTDTALTEVAGGLGAAVDVSSQVPLESGTLEIPFDITSLAPDARVAALHFDEATGTFDLPANQDVDLAAGKVKVTTKKFSPIVVVDLNEFEKIWKTELVEPREGSGSTTQFVDAVLALDSSGSMADNDPEDARKTAAKLFIDALIPGDRAGALDFDDAVRQLQPLTTDFAAVKLLIDSIDSSGGTDIGAAVAGALDELDANGAATHARIIVLLTDGDGSYDDALTARAADSKTTVYTVGLGSAVNESLLQGLASATGGKYFQVANASQLPNAYERIIGDIGAPDTDKDGLADEAETAGWRTHRGVVYKTDPANPDTDGDGLLDGQEAGRPVQGSFGIAYSATSNPLKIDTDGDTVADGDELYLDTSALMPDTDADGLKDDIELAFGSDPTEINPDGDTYLDNDEYRLGLDPLAYDLTDDEAAAALLGGAIYGDWVWGARNIGRMSDAQLQSLQYIGGQLASGVAVVGDIRDVIANLGNGDLWDAFISAVGFAPWVGDGVKLARSITKFSKLGAFAEKSAFRYIDKSKFSISQKKFLLGQVFGTGAKVFPKILDGGPIKTVVYFGFDPISSKAVYVGITKDFTRRSGQWTGIYRIERIKTGMSPVSRGQARAIEEALIVQAGSRFNNKIHSISPTHPYYSDALAWGEDWLIANGVHIP